MENIAQIVIELNKHGVCTKGFYTFGCGCTKCFREIKEAINKVFNK